MPANLQPFPSVNDPVVEFDKNQGQPGTIRDTWQSFLTTLFFRSGGPGGPIPSDAITVGASPFQYEADFSGAVLVSGGTVSQIAIVRDGTAYVTGATSGAIPVVRGDIVKVTHTGAPSMTFLPSESTGQN